jgi:hypothetical protein
MTDQYIQLHRPDPLHPDIVASLILDADLTALNEGQRVAYYIHRCREIGVDPAETPFALIKLDGKLTLYPKASCAHALTRIHRLSVEIRSSAIDSDGMMTVCARVLAPDGTFRDATGVLDLTGIDIIGGVDGYGKSKKGIGKANGMMKCETKATRRAVLAKCGLGAADEDVSGGRVYRMDMSTGAISEDEHVQAIDVGTGESTPVERITMLVAEIAGANKVAPRKVYETAVKESTPFDEYDDFPWKAADLTAADAGAVAGWLELNRKAKRWTSSDAKPRSRPQPPAGPAAPEEEPPF